MASLNDETTISGVNGQEPLVQVKNLKKYFDIPRKGKLHAVDDVSFDVFPGETLGLVGESGCGKTTVGQVVMRLQPKTAGELLFNGKSVFSAKGEEDLELRKSMQIIFQDPYSSLNPRKTIRRILTEPYRVHKYGSKAAVAEAIEKLCDMVDLSRDLLDCYPHELDGGMRQVVGIARALSLSAVFIVCDEPVSSLDVSVQARTINLLKNLQRQLGISYLFISHDLSVVRHISNRIAIMYLGQIVEMAPTDSIFASAYHPYAIALLSAVPRVEQKLKKSRIVLKGDVPSPMNPKPGCRFAPRCWMAHEDCADTDPQLTEIEPGHFVACRYARESQERAQVPRNI
ncbi:MAG: ABC transporter ATP-binding protein [Peptococcaceae bacterium]|jgi:oligopeptide/dipeptide ABC transporter ATP-binding protein|nr:ABC transporter ATP-binding protein [Peptococcaceae bacterium]